MPNQHEQAVLDELQVRPIRPEEKGRWNQLVRQHHYLKSCALVGEQIRYVAANGQDRWRALMEWKRAKPCV